MKRYHISVVILATVFIAAFLAACGNSGEPRVIGEKQETTVSEQSTASEQQTGKEQETETAETEMGDGTGVRELTEAPERYKTEIREGGIVLQADAPVIVPDHAKAVKKKARTANFTQEEYNQVKVALTETMGIQWRPSDSYTTQPVAENRTSESDEIELLPLTRLTTKETDGRTTEKAEDDSEINNSHLTVDKGTGKDGNDYRLSYRTSESDEIETISLIWLTREETDGRTTEKPGMIYSPGIDPSDSTREKRQEFDKKGKALVEASGFKNYEIYRGRWRESYFKTEGKNISEMEYWLTFTPSVNGAGCNTPPTTDLLGKSRIRGPYIDMYFSEDGTLNQLKIIDKVQVEEGQDNGIFLLPFEAVCQLFEQYCKDLFPLTEVSRIHDPAAEEGITSLPNEFITGAKNALGTTIKVDEVKLEYAFITREDSQTQNELELIPVWNFYGNVVNPDAWSVNEMSEAESYNIARQVAEGIILSIRADDGQILTNGS